MYKVNKNSKTITEITKITFKDAGCKERQDLQEWIVNYPEILGEPLLIIQKEFDGFNDTNERLDLLALDKEGRLVVIENKLDDSGKDVVWQALKYASYCSTLTTLQIKDIYEKYINKNNLNINAEQTILDFLNGGEFGIVDDFTALKLNEGNTQRIFFIAGKFRREVLSTATWLSNFGVDISCVIITPFLDNGTIYIDADKIFPQEELKDYSIKLADKERQIKEQEKSNSNAEALRNKFWKQFIDYYNQKDKLFENITVSEKKKDHWLSCGSGIKSGCSYTFLTCKDYCGVELTLASENKDINKKIFDKLYFHKDEIERNLNLGIPIIWAKLEEKDMSRITIKREDLSLWNEDKWTEINAFLTETMIKFYKEIEKYKPELKIIK